MNVDGLCLCFVALLIVGCERVKAHSATSDTYPESFPFHALVKGILSCSGILISEQYVLTPASCVNRAAKISVFLGFRGYPYYIANHNEPNGQIYHSTEYVIHENFVLQNKDCHLNDIALVKLPEPVQFSKTVQPAKLITESESQQLQGKIVDVTGWILSMDTNMKLAQVQIRNQDTCTSLFGDKYFRSHQICVEWLSKPHLNLLGNAVSVNGKIIGYQINTPKCLKPFSCTGNDMILNIAPFLDWIYEKTHSQMEPRQKDSDIDKKIEALQGIIKGVKEQHQADIADVKKKLDELINNLQTKQTQEVNYAVRLDEQANDTRTEIRNSERRQNASVLKLQEEVQDSRTEIANGLAAQKAEYENLAKRIADLSAERAADDARLTKIDTALENIKQQNEITELKIQNLDHKFLEEINKINAKLSLIEQKLVDPKDLDDKITHSLINTHEKLDKLHNNIQDLYGTLEKIKSKESEIYSHVNQQLLEASKKHQEDQESLQAYFNSAFEEYKSKFQSEIVSQKDIIYKLSNRLHHLEANIWDPVSV